MYHLKTIFSYLQCGTPVLPSQSQLIMLTTGGCTLLLLLAAAGEAWLDTDRG